MVDLVSGDDVPLFHPRRQSWADHFAWDADLTEIIGLTPTGRAMIEALHLNRAPLVALRKLLVAAGVHPPTESKS